MIDLITCNDPTEYVEIVKLSENNIPDSFFVSPKEYSEYILDKAYSFQTQAITKSFLLNDLESNKTIGYISLICDTITTTKSEKEKAELKTVPFNSFPSLKIAQLAISEEKWVKEKYNHCGSFLIQFSISQALMLNKEICGCRFLTVDADIENNPNVDIFYTRNGFKTLGNEKYRKRKQLPMYKDIFEI